MTKFEKQEFTAKHINRGEEGKKLFFQLAEDYHIDFGEPIAYDALG